MKAESHAPSQRGAILSIMLVSTVLLFGFGLRQPVHGRIQRIDPTLPGDSAYALVPASMTGSLCDLIAPCTDLSIPGSVLQMNYDAELGFFRAVSIVVSIMVDSAETIRDVRVLRASTGRDREADTGAMALVNHVRRHFRSMVDKGRLLRPPGYQRDRRWSSLAPLRYINIYIEISDAAGCIAYAYPDSGSNIYSYVVPREAFR